MYLLRARSNAARSDTRPRSLRALSARGPHGAALTITIIDVVRRDRRTTLRVHGEVDLATAPALRERLLQALQEDPARIEIDLHGVEFLDVVGVGVLEQAAATAEHRGIEFELTRATGLALRILELTGSRLTVSDAGAADG